MRRLGLTEEGRGGAGAGSGGGGAGAAGNDEAWRTGV